jgi:hypothetical protein
MKPKDNQTQTDKKIQNKRYANDTNMSQYFQGTQPYTTKLNNLSTLS